MRLNALGRSLAAQPGGTRATIAAVARRSSNGTLMRATTSTRVVARSVVLPRPVFFASDSDDLRAPDRRYLATLRRKLAGLRSITCTGYTDSQDDNRYNAFLGKQRAEVTCAFLVRGTCMTTVRVTKGERAPQCDQQHGGRSRAQPSHRDHARLPEAAGLTSPP